MSYSWQNPRGLGSCRADRFPGCTSHFCPCRVVTSLSVPSAGSLIIMHMLTRLQEMSQFVVCFASEPARYLACVRKAACPTDTPRSEDMAQGYFLLHDRAGKEFSMLRSAPIPFLSPPAWKVTQLELNLGVVCWTSFQSHPICPPPPPCHTATLGLSVPFLSKSCPLSSLKPINGQD